MDLVRAGFGDDIDRAAWSGYITGSVGPGYAREFLGCIGIWKGAADDAERINVARPIEREIGSPGTNAIGCRSTFVAEYGAAFRYGAVWICAHRVDRCIGNACCREHQGSRITAVQWQVGHNVLFHNRLNGIARTLHRRCLCRDNDILSLSAHSHGHLNRGNLPHRQDNPLLLIACKPILADADDVWTDRDRRNPERPVRPRYCLSLEIRLGLDYGYFCSRNDRARIVLHGSVQGCG